MVIELWLLLCSLILTSVFFFIQLKRPHNFPPGPKWLPVIGNLFEMKKLCQKFGGQHLVTLKLAKKYNTNVLGLKMGNEYIVFVSSYETIKNVWTRNEFLGRPDNFCMRLRCFGTKCGITGVDGPLWVEQKNFLIQYLKKLGFGKKTMEVMINDELKEMLETLEEIGPDVNFTKLFQKAILNVLWTIATGDRILWNDPRLNNLLELMTERNCVFDMTGGTLNLLPWLRHLIPEQIGYNLILKINKKLKDFFSEIIEMHKKHWISNKQDDIIYSFLTEMNKEAALEHYNDNQLLVLCLDIFIGGSTTTSSTLNFIFIVLILYPEIQEKIAYILNSNFDPNKPLSFADRLKVPYVQAFIMEVERMHTIDPILGPRRALQNTIIENYSIPKNTTVFANIYSVHNDEEYWGDPSVFRPERFLNDKREIVANDRLILFGLGKRRCLGDALARASIFLIMSSVIRKYKVCSTPGADLPTLIPVPGVMLSAKKYLARIIPRKI